MTKEILETQPSPGDSDEGDIGLEASSYRIERIGGKLVVDIFDIFKGGDLYASQDWVKEKDIPTAVNHNDGFLIKEYPRFPSIYWGNINGSIVFIVGDGHHRIADALLRGIPIKGEIDLELKNLNLDLLVNPQKASEKYAYLGLGGIWPYRMFLDKYNQIAKTITGNLLNVEDLLTFQEPKKKNKEI